MIKTEKKKSVRARASDDLQLAGRFITVAAAGRREHACNIYIYIYTYHSIYL